MCASRVALVRAPTVNTYVPPDVSSVATESWFDSVIPAVRFSVPQSAVRTVTLHHETEPRALTESNSPSALVTVHSISAVRLLLWMGTTTRAIGTARATALAPQKNQRSLRFLLAGALAEPAGAPPLGGSAMLLHLLYASVRTRTRRTRRHAACMRAPASAALLGPRRRNRFRQLRVRRMLSREGRRPRLKARMQI